MSLQQCQIPPTVLTTSSVLSAKNWPFGLTWLPPTAYLVGGIVRDALLGRYTDYMDLDFVLPERAVETARAIARHYNAGFVLLDAERQIARVVFQGATADFAQQVGNSLYEDLHRRDFTVNAIAYSPHREELIDPLHGYTDLHQRLLRMVSWQNLQEDPLRLLRAYRQAAQLDFYLDADTEAAIQKLAPLIGTIAAERVQAELGYLLSTDKGTPWLKSAWDDGLLAPWFPNVTATNLSLVAAVDEAVTTLATARPAFLPEIQRPLRERSGIEKGNDRGHDSRRTWLFISRLTNLVSPDPDYAKTTLTALKFSRAEVQAVTTVLRALPNLQTNQPLSATDKYHLFRAVGHTFPALAVVGVTTGAPIETILTLLDHFLAADDLIAHPKPLLSGQDLMTALNLPSGPRIGQLLAAIQLAHVEGTVTTAEEAIAWARERLTIAEAEES